MSPLNPPADPSTPPPPPVDPGSPPGPTPSQTVTIGSLIDSLAADRKALAGALASQAQVDAAVASSSAKVEAGNKALAAGLKSAGDVVVDNGGGTFTGYFADSSPDGFHTETLKGPSTPVPAL